MELISVIIPTYNREKLIERSINSVLNQTYKNIELIVVDDFSSDNTEKVVKKYTDERLHYIKLEKNSGACVARNVGIENAKGEYIAFQDSDDVWHDNKLEIQLEYMKKNNAEVSFCNMMRYKINEKEPKEIPQDCPEGVIKYETLLKKSVVSTQCLMTKKSCFDNIKFDINLPRLQDWDIILELSKKYKIYHINTALVDIYIQKDSISSHPERGKIALDILKQKNLEYIEKNSEVNFKWLIYMGNYKLDNHENPANEYAEALKIKFKMNLYIKYILAKFNILIPIYKKMKKI